jgi:branched-chain amino acid transport system substrate-binding protein
LFESSETDWAYSFRKGRGQRGRSQAHPSDTAFSSFLLQAQASGAKVIGLATGGKDVANAVKQASEFGISGSGQSFAALLLWINDVKAIGLELGQGMMLTEPFYWDQTDETREFSQRFFEEIGRMPTEGQAGTYSSVLHYLKAVEHAGTTEEQAVVASMRELPINDFMTDNGSIRVDGRVMRDFYLYEVKSPDGAVRRIRTRLALDSNAALYATQSCRHSARAAARFRLKFCLL